MTFFPASRSASASSSSRASRRSSSTSVSRTLPSRPPSHWSSSRTGSLQSSSTTGRKVRRSDRSRRVATRIWWTSSGSSPMRTPGSWAMSFATAPATAAWAISAALASRGSLPAGATSGASSARGAERAHDLGDQVGQAGTGVAQARRHRRGDRRRRVGLDLDFELAETGDEPRTVEHRDFVVDDLAEPSRPATSRRTTRSRRVVEARDG